ncbi:hypothetical protein L0F63_000798 [Massospora cicadina]|nr:hypothetical protein L0F63_000798 [Massospora cicadina]
MKCYTALIPSHFSLRAQETKPFNVTSVWHKHGIAAIPTKFGTLATILIYTSGVGFLSHSGVKIRQGLHAKMVQYCANALRVSRHSMYVPNTSITVTSVTAASATASYATASSDTAASTTGTSATATSNTVTSTTAMPSVAASASSDLNSMDIPITCHQQNEHLQ